MTNSGPRGEVDQNFAAQWQSAKNQPDTPIALQPVDELFPYMFRSRVQVHATQFAWMARDKGHWKIFEAEREVVTEPGVALPVVAVPKGVAESADDPWLIVTFRVDASR